MIAFYFIPRFEGEGGGMHLRKGGRRWGRREQRFSRTTRKPLNFILLFFFSYYIWTRFDSIKIIGGLLVTKLPSWNRETSVCLGELSPGGKFPAEVHQLPSKLSTGRFEICKNFLRLKKWSLRRKVFVVYDDKKTSEEFGFSTPFTRYTDTDK